MRIVPAVMALIALALGAASVSSYARWTGARRDTAAEWPGSGMAVLESLRCRYAETRQSFVRGVEDRFSTDGDESGRIHPRLGGSIRNSAYFSEAGYDSWTQDTVFQDFLEIPAQTARGVFVIGMRRLDGAANDDLVVGDLEGMISETPDSQRQYARLPVAQIAQTAGWSRRGDVYWASLDDIDLGSGSTLLEAIRSSSAGTFRVVDILVSDDTMVDFVGISACLEPEPGLGMTMRVQRSPNPLLSAPGYLLADCVGGDDGARFCDAYRGDTACSAALPVLCYVDEDLPAPAELADVAGSRSQMSAQRLWSGGRLALSEAGPADRFASISDADAYCAASFGDRWRVADYHLGGRTSGFVGLGASAMDRVHAWVDIRDQPYATCWSRRGSETDE